MSSSSATSPVAQGRTGKGQEKRDLITRQICLVIRLNKLLSPFVYVLQTKVGCKLIVPAVLKVTPSHLLSLLSCAIRHKGCDALTRSCTDVLLNLADNGLKKKTRPRVKLRHQLRQWKCYKWKTTVRRAQKIMSLYVSQFLDTTS